MTKPLEQPAGPVVLSANVLVDGRFIPAGDATPFTEQSLPPHLREYLASGQEDFYHPSTRNYYHQPGPELGAGVIYQGTGGQWTRREAARAAAGLQEQIYAEQEAERDQQLPAETQEVLETEHSRRIDKLKAQASYNQKIADGVYEREEAEASAKETQFYVRRGGEMARVERAKLKPGESTFVRRTANTKSAASSIQPAHRHLRR
jgi:hypothetical protein